LFTEIPRTPPSDPQSPQELGQVEAKVVSRLGAGVAAMGTAAEIARSPQPVVHHLEARGLPDRKPAKTRRKREAAGQIRIKNYSQVIQYSKILIVALEEVLDYDPLRHHNQPPPELRIEDPEYLGEIRDLVAELRSLNSFLESSPRRPQKASRAVIDLTKHFNTFLNSYSKSLGKGAGYLTIGVIASLLYQAGIGQDIIASILSHAKPPSK
jgi:hypothetical protein